MSKKVWMILGVLCACVLAGCTTKDEPATASVQDEPTTGALTMPEYTTEMTGRIARFTDGQVMLFADDYGPIILGGDMNFEGLNNGDKLTIYCDGIKETYPARTSVVEMTLHERGTAADLSEEVLETLSELGYELTE